MERKWLKPGRIRFGFTILASRQASARYSVLPSPRFFLTRAVLSPNVSRMRKGHIFRCAPCVAYFVRVLFSLVGEGQLIQVHGVRGLLGVSVLLIVDRNAPPAAGDRPMVVVLIECMSHSIQSD